jgi:single-stranded DNA-binding protein
MNLYVLATGALIGDPQRREGAKGPFATATIRVNGDEAVLVSVIAFGAEAEQLCGFAKGDALAVSGRARLTSWTSRDGAEKHGISVVVEQIAAAKPRRRSAAAPQHRPAGTRVRYSPPRSARDSGPPMPQDPVDDLWRGPIP